MSQKIITQNGFQNENKTSIITEHNFPVENSENSNVNKKESIKILESEYVFCTPMKKIKFHSYLLETPKKEKRTQQNEGPPIVGKNLLKIFETM